MSCLRHRMSLVSDVLCAQARSDVIGGGGGGGGGADDARHRVLGGHDAVRGVDEGQEVHV